MDNEDSTSPVAQGDPLLDYTPSLAPAYRYSTFWPRFWAGVIDGLVFAPLGFVDAFVFERFGNVAVLVTWFTLSSLAFLVYSVLLHGLVGQTVGKMVTGVRVLDVSEKKLSLTQAALRDSVPVVFTVVGVALEIPMILQGINPNELLTRDVPYLLFAFAALGWFVAELITMLTNNKRRAVHDFIAGSVVVRTR